MHAPASLVIDRTSVTARGKKLLDLPTDRSAGVDAKDKRPNANEDDYVTAVFDEFAKAPRPSVLTIEVDDDTPYRVLFEILFTLHQLHISRWNLRRKNRSEELVVESPAAPLDSESKVIWMGLFDVGVSIRSTSGKIQTGCDGIGPGFAVPNKDGAFDLGALAACTRKLAATSQLGTHGMVVSAPRATPFAQVWDVIEAARNDTYRDVVFAMFT
ncbi:hypothetical protein BH09MYX1_BH09MYX1_13270 [soil metagenome]